jgi:hypothetical protein
MSFTGGRGGVNWSGNSHCVPELRLLNVKSSVKFWAYVLKANDSFRGKLAPYLDCLCCTSDIYFVLMFEYLRIANHNDMHSEYMTISFATSIWRSTQLQSIRGMVFGGSTFDTAKVLDIIIATKRISREKERLAIVNMKLCLNSLNFVGAVCERVNNLVRTNFDPKSHVHVSLLEAVWSSLKPEVRRSALPNHSSVIASDDWSDIGFQGTVYIS